MTLSRLTRAGLALAPGVDTAREQETDVLVVDLPSPACRPNTASACAISMC